MFCSISGEVPTEPVISKKSGHLYEKRVIEKYVREHGKCPVSGQELSEMDLLPVLANKAVRPRAVAAAGIPGLLGMLQNEWDELMLETYTLRQHLAATRQELSQALYQHDAACRVIARLLRERDEARSLALNNGGAGVSVQSSEAGGLTADMLAAMEAKCEELSKARKARGKGAPANLATATDLSSFTARGGSAIDLPSAVTCLAVQGEAVAAGCANGATAMDGRILKGHEGSVSGVSFSGESLLSSSSDGSVKIWSASGDCLGTLVASADRSPVTSIRAHPTGTMAACTLQTGGYSLLDISRGTLVVRTPGDTDAITGDMHPDGLLLAGGATNGSVTIWDLRTQVSVASLSSGGASIAALRFSENGYHLGGAAGSAALLWDMRKLVLTKELQVNAPISSVAFDNSGSYFAIASGNSIKTQVVKEWSTAMELSSVVNGAITAIAWGADARSIVAGSSEGVVKVYGRSD